MFRKLKGVDLSYERQGFVRFTCLTYNDQPQEMKDKILNLCIECAKDKYQALFELMTTQKSAINIAHRHFVSDTILYRLRKKFYLTWWEERLRTPPDLPKVGR